MERAEEERIESMRRAIIEQERQRLLKEHATKLLGYLPKVTERLVALCHGEDGLLMFRLGTQLRASIHTVFVMVANCLLPENLPNFLVDNSWFQPI